ncbi:MAG: L,D-transpeptidase family protein [Solirubrobacteraceae bacterium]
MRIRVLGGGLLLILIVAGAVGLTAGHGSPSGLARSSQVTGPAPRPTVLTRLPHATLADGTARLVIRLSGLVAPGSPAPTLAPAVAGRWAAGGRLETFTPASTLQPCTDYRLTIGSRTQAVGRSPLGRRRVVRFAVACPSIGAAQRALARLRYLPYRFEPDLPTGTAGGPEPQAAAARAAFRPPPGTFQARIFAAPALAAGQLDAITRGALIVFQTDHNLTPSGTADAATWASLIGARAAGLADPAPYTFVTVSQAIPQTLEVHRGNRVVLTSPVNTGVAGAPTANGVFPIFERFTSTTMTGTNPDGSHYSDPGVPWVNYFNGGDAVHGFVRASYGTPQSDGCVELPPATAAAVYPMLALGDVVAVSG